MTPTTLVLWDVDGTLLMAGDVGRACYAAAFERFAGQPLHTRVEMAGRTDPVILLDTLAAHGIEPTTEAFERFSALLGDEYERERDALRARGRVLPGVRDALATLAAEPGVVQSVLTGNVHRVAIAKLTAFGLDRCLDLQAGAYGSDAPVRATLVGIARERAAGRYGVQFDGTATVIVGDTPHDVGAAIEAGAGLVAVASGWSSAADLAAAGATTVLDDLTDTAAVLRAVLPARTR